MALTLNKTGITTGNTVEAYHVTQSIDAFTGDIAYDITLSGSLQVTGSVAINGLTNPISTNVLTYDTTTGQVFYTASNALPDQMVDTSSFVQNSQTGSFLTTSSFAAQTGSFSTGSSYVSSSILTPGIVGGNEITFFRGDGSTHMQIINTGSGGPAIDTGSFYVSSSIDTSTSPSTNLNNTIVFEQGDGTTESVIVTPYTYEYYEPQDYTFSTISGFTTQKGDHRFTLDDPANNCRFFLPQVVDKIGVTLEIFSVGGTGRLRIVTNSNSFLTFGGSLSTSTANGAYAELASPSGVPANEDKFIRLMAVTGSSAGIGDYVSEWIVTDYWDETLRTTTDPASNPLSTRITFGT